MESSEEKYIQRMKEIQAKLKEPNITKKVDMMLRELAKELKCEVEFYFNAYPEVEDYEEHMESEDFIEPRNVVTMTLKDFVEHINKEKGEFKVLIDPMYLKPGLNEINDVLTTTVNDNVIIVPIRIKK
jgi:hypothetical protein